MAMNNTRQTAWLWTHEVGGLGMVADFLTMLAMKFSAKDKVANLRTGGHAQFARTLKRI